MRFLVYLTIALTYMNLALAENIELTVETQGLGPMKGQHYEGWNIIKGNPVSTGRFSIAKDGSIYQVDRTGHALKMVGSRGVAHFDVSREHLRAKLFVLTIEPNNDLDAGPSPVHLMGGLYNQQKADLTLEHESSLTTNFLNADGSFILAAPTGGEL